VATQNRGRRAHICRLAKAFDLVGIDQHAEPLELGRQMLESLVECLAQEAQVFSQFPCKGDGGITPMMLVRDVVRQSAASASTDAAWLHQRGSRGRQPCGASAATVIGLTENQRAP
jgi:hypothetical protein